jgi:hypothetical protein
MGQWDNGTTGQRDHGPQDEQGKAETLKAEKGLQDSETTDYGTKRERKGRRAPLGVSHALFLELAS